MAQINQSIVGTIASLASHYYYENDLSNITVMLCNNCYEFKEFFVHFFFKDLDIDKIISIEREVPDDNDRSCRVDIMIYLEDDRYLIEVKIGDKGQHFTEYVKKYETTPDHLGYIVNYEWVQPGFEVKKWKDLFLELKKRLPSIEDSVSASLMTGYLEYLKSVCSIIDIDKPMKLNTIKSLHQFFDIAKAKLTIQEEGYSVIAEKIYNPTSGVFMAPYTSLSFNINYVDMRRRSIKGRLFLYHGLEYEVPEIYIGFASDLRSIKARMEDKKFLKKGRTFDRPELALDDWYNIEYLWFKMSNVDKMLDSEESDQQESIIGEYISEVIGRVVSI